MKSTRPFDNDEIRRISNVFSRMYEVRNRGLCFLFVIVGLYIGCGRDTDMVNTETVVFVEVKPPLIRAGLDRDTWHAAFDVVFNGSPVDLKAEFEVNRLLTKFFRLNWEQTGNIVTLLFEFKLQSIAQTTDSPIPDRTLIFEREHQKQSVEVTLTWADGRKIFTVEAYPPESLFVGRSDILIL